MFRFTQEPSSGSYFVPSENYNYDSIVLVVNDVVNVMAAYQPAVQACLPQFVLLKMGMFMLETCRGL